MLALTPAPVLEDAGHRWDPCALSSKHHPSQADSRRTLHVSSPGALLSHPLLTALADMEPAGSEGAYRPRLPRAQPCASVAQRGLAAEWLSGLPPLSRRSRALA